MLLVAGQRSSACILQGTMKSKPGPVRKAFPAEYMHVTEGSIYLNRSASVRGSNVHHDPVLSPAQHDACTMCCVRSTDVQLFLVTAWQVPI